MSSETTTSPNFPGDFGHSGRYFRGGTTYLPAALYGGEVVGSGLALTSPTEGSGEVGRSVWFALPATASSEEAADA